jgi:hypothetical protein
MTCHKNLAEDSDLHRHFRPGEPTLCRFARVKSDLDFHIKQRFYLRFKRHFWLFISTSRIKARIRKKRYAGII